MQSSYNVLNMKRRSHDVTLYSIALHFRDTKANCNLLTMISISKLFANTFHVILRLKAYYEVLIFETYEGFIMLILSDLK